MTGTIAPRHMMPARARQLPARTALACALILQAMIGGPSHAQQGAPPAPTIDPRQTEKNFERFQLEQQRARRPPVPVPRVARPDIQADTRPLFVLKSVSIEGAAALPADVLAESYQPYLGRKVSQADLAAITVKIGDQYREAGYHLSRAIVPPQDIRGGHIRIRVIEGEIAETELKGSGAEQFGLRPLFNPVIAERPSRLPTLERQLVLVNNTPGVRVDDTALEEIGEATGRFRLIVHVSTAHITPGIGINNAGTPAVGSLQTYLSTGFNSFLVPGDSLGVNLSTVPDSMRELRFGRLLYDTPMDSNSVRLGATASYSEVWPGDARREIDTNIKNQFVELRASVDPWQSRKSGLRLTVALDYNDTSEQSIFGTHYKDHVRNVDLRADYRLSDDLNGLNYVSATLRQGLSALGASHKWDSFTSNPFAPANFTLGNFVAARIQKLNEFFSLKLAATGQLSSSTLLTSQKFYIGGPAFGRGYYSGDLSGDNGIAGSAELRFEYRFNDEIFKGYQLYGFYDRGMVWDRLGDADRFSMSSAGGGVRLYFAGQLYADLAIAAPLDLRTLNNPGLSPRFLFSVSKSFELCPEITQMRCF